MSSYPWVATMVAIPSKKIEGKKNEGIWKNEGIKKFNEWENEGF